MITVHRNPNQSEKIALAYLNLSRSLGSAQIGSCESANSTGQAAGTFIELKFPADQWPALHRLIAQEERQYAEFDPDPEIIPWSR
jgi:hypothetical protein